MWSKRQIASQVLVRSGLGAILRKAPRWRQGVLILNYHRIGDPGDQMLDHGLWSATPKAFERQMRFLRRHCRIISPAQLLEQEALAGQACAMVTFDDGYRDNYEVAFPILQSLGVPATFFVSTGFTDRPRLPWWDEISWMICSSRRSRLSSAMLALDVTLEGNRQRAIDAALLVYKRLPGEATAVFMDDLGEACGTGRCPANLGRDLWMTWDMLRAMSEAGMTVGGHTVDHPVLSRLSPLEQEEQIGGCMQRLEEELAVKGRFFAYPRGKEDSFSDATRAALYQAKIDVAFSYYGGFNHPGHADPYDVRRVPVEMTTRREAFEALVSMPSVFTRS